MGMIVSWMLVAAAIGAFAVTALSGCFVIPALHKLHFGQTIRESGPTWHNKKQAGHQDADKNDRSTHCGGSRFLQMGLNALDSLCLSDLESPKEGNDERT